MSHVVNRRVFGCLAAALFLAGCATPVPLPPGVAGEPIGAVHVSARSKVWPPVIAQMVEQELTDQLGPRYSPGAPGAGTLTVDLADIDLPGGSTGGRAGRFHGADHEGTNIDYLKGYVTLSQGRRTVVRFPLVATKIATGDSVMLMGPDPQRLQTLARTFSYWLLKKLG